ncbi:hypothetical protein BH10ACT11_BH10ACT11_15650 [soil metagenome]
MTASRVLVLTNEDLADANEVLEAIRPTFVCGPSFEHRVAEQVRSRFGLPTAVFFFDADGHVVAEERA